MSGAARTTSAKNLFLKEFFRAPQMVGSIIPTSQFAVRSLLDPIAWTNVRTVVEYGPGTGVYTRAILHRLGPNACLIAIDTNAAFIDYLRSTISDDRLICVTGSAADVEAILASRGEQTADYVISGLPFSTLPRSVAHAIMEATARIVRPGGAFLVYQYSRFVLPMLADRFDRISQEKIWRCIPPARLFWAHKHPTLTISDADDESSASE